VRIRVIGQAPIEARSTSWSGCAAICAGCFRSRSSGGSGREEIRRDGGGDDCVIEVRSGVPFYRLGGTGGESGIPLPSSTQWEIVAEAGNGDTPLSMN